MNEVTQLKAIFDHIVMLFIIDGATKYLTLFPVTVFMDDLEEKCNPSELAFS
jgi:hypothetical protein